MPELGVEYSNVPFQMLASLADKQHQYYLLQQKKEQEELKQKYELAKMLDPLTLSKNLESEVASNSIGNLRGNVSNYIKQNPNASSSQLQDYIQGELTTLSTWNNKVKSIKDNIDATIKAMPQDKSVNLSALRSAAISKALYNPNTKSLKNINELDDQHDFVQDVWNTGGYNLIDLSKAENNVTDLIKAQPTVEKDVTVSISDPKTNKKTLHQQRLSMPAYAEWDDNNNKLVIRKGKDGLVADDVYTKFIGQQGSTNDKLFDFKTKREIESGMAGMLPEDVFNADGSIKDQKAFDYAKKRLVGDYIYNNSPLKQLEKDITAPVYKTTVINQAPAAVSEENRPYHPLTIIEGIQKGKGGFRGSIVKDQGVEGYDVTDVFSSYKPFKLGSLNLSYKKVIYNPSDNKFYFRTGSEGKLNSQTPDQFGSSIIQSAPDLGFKVDKKIFKSLPNQTDNTGSTNSGITWK